MLIFDPANVGSGAGPWLQKAAMISRRWYPTATTLPDGRVMVFSGASGVGPLGQLLLVETPEIYNPYIPDSPVYSWEAIPSAGKEMFTYPFMFVLHTGKIFWAGYGMLTSVLDMTSTTPTWADMLVYGAFTHNPLTEGALFMSSGSAVTYAPGKILKCGGFDPSGCIPNGRTARIDFNVATPDWDELPDVSMVHARKDHTLVILPDGRVLAVGGQGDCEDTCTDDDITCADCLPVRHAEWIDPNAASPTWIDLAEATIPRGYHSTAVLLADGRVLSSGGENSFGYEDLLSSRSGELFKPPYYFNTSGGLATRPSISTAPSQITYGGSFTITMPSGQNIDKVSLVRLGAPSHGFDQNQRYVPLVFTECSSTMLEINSPANGKIAPPGYYMLFILAEPTASQPNLTPSVAKYVKLVHCDGDLNGDCERDGADLAILLNAWDTSDQTPCVVTVPADLNRDCLVNGSDLALLLGDVWHQPCPAGCGDAGCGESSATGGGGESAMFGAPESGDGCGGGDEQFIAWLDAGDIDAFMQWLACIWGQQ